MDTENPQLLIDAKGDPELSRRLRMAAQTCRQNQETKITNDPATSFG